MLVTTAIVAGSFTKVPSLSSASTTIQSPRAEARVGAVGVDDAAVDDGGVQLGGIEQRGDQRGGRGLAVGAADGDRPFQAHQLAQHLGAAHDRQQAARAATSFGVVGLDGGGDDDDAGVGEVLGAVADLDGDAEAAQALDVGVVGQVAAAHLVAEVVQDLGDAAHADAADADEMDRADREGQRPSCRGLLLRAVAADAAPITRSARRVRRVAPAAAARAAAARGRGPLGLGHQVGRGSSASMRRRQSPLPAAARRRRPWRAPGIGRLVIVGGDGDRGSAGSPAARRRSAPRPSRRRSGRSPDGQSRSRSGMSLKNGASSAVDA